MHTHTHPENTTTLGPSVTSTTTTLDLSLLRPPRPWTFRYFDHHDPGPSVTSTTPTHSGPPPTSRRDHGPSCTGPPLTPRGPHGKGREGTRVPMGTPSLPSNPVPTGPPTRSDRRITGATAVPWAPGSSPCPFGHSRKAQVLAGGCRARGAPHRIRVGTGTPRLRPTSPGGSRPLPSPEGSLEGERPSLRDGARDGGPHRERPE